MYSFARTPDHSYFKDFVVNESRHAIDFHLVPKETYGNWGFAGIEKSGQVVGRVSYQLFAAWLIHPEN